MLKEEGYGLPAEDIRQINKGYGVSPAIQYFLKTDTTQQHYLCSALYKSAKALYDGRKWNN